MRFWPKPPTAEQLMEQAEADAREIRERPVPYYRRQERLWRKHTRRWVLMLPVWAILAALIDHPAFTGGALVVTFLLGSQWQDTRRRQETAAKDAWQAENQETITAMREGGLLQTPRDMIVMMRDAEPPPGMKRAEWVATHDALLRDWDEQHGS